MCPAEVKRVTRSFANGRQPGRRGIGTVGLTDHCQWIASELALERMSPRTVSTKNPRPAFTPFRVLATVIQANNWECATSATEIAWTQRKEVGRHQ